MQTIALKVLKENAFFVHLKKILLAMLPDDDMLIRCLEVKKILGLREKKLNIPARYNTEKLLDNDRFADKIKSATQISSSV